MRLCVMHQLHLRDSSPKQHIELWQQKVDEQLRRRVFWSAYQLDRAVGSMFDIPFSVADYVINVPMDANIADEDLMTACQAQQSAEVRGESRYTSISSALHVVHCGQVQSEILNIALHSDFTTEFDPASNWRLRILEKLERWKSLCHHMSDADSKTYTSPSWVHMIYSFSLAMLFRPTRQNATGPSAEWTAKSCCQALLIFRRFQRHNTISEAWMGLIQRFECGVTLLYCFFINPPEYRTPTFNSPEVAQAVRACSVILSLLAEKWAESECLRDVFDLLAAEVPLHEQESAPPITIRSETSTEILSLMPQVQRLVIHRATMRMIREIATETFNRPHRIDHHDPTISEPGWTGSIAGEVTQNGGGSEHGSYSTAQIFQPTTPKCFDTATSGSNQNFDLEELGFPGLFEFDLLS